MKKNSVVFAVFVVLSLSLGIFAVQSGQDLFQKALAKERAEGNLEEAIVLYQKVIDESQDTALKAQAQLRIGLCYERLGQQNSKQAQDAFQKVVDNYPEQTETVKAAREKLSFLMRAQSVVNKVEKEFNLREIWAGPGASGFVGPSPDGRFLSCLDESTGNLGIWEIATGKMRLLTKDADWATHFVLDSIISPDGRLVAYSWYTYDPQSESDYSYSLHIVGIDGSGHRVLYFANNYEVYPESWSSDGQQIAARMYEGKTGECSILLVTVADGSSQVLKSFDGPLWLNMCYSSDNRYVIFDHPVEKDSGNRNISMLAVDGSGEFPLIEHPANDSLLGWVPGSDSMLFLSDRVGTFDAYLVDVTEHTIQGFPQLVRRNLGDVGPLGFTRDGSFFFKIDSRWASIQISPFDMETGKIQERNTTPILGNNFFPKWSPNGDHLAFVKEKDRPDLGFRRTLHIRNLETGEEREFAGFLDVSEPCWSSDGRFILVRGHDSRKKIEDYLPGIYRIEMERGEPKLLIEAINDLSGEVKSPKWSSDGKAVYYMKKSKILVRELDSGKEKVLFSHPDLALAMDVSPDGKQLVFGTHNFEKDSGILMLMPVTGGETRELCTLDGFRNTAGVDWMPDGKHVIYSEFSQKKASLWRIAVDGGKPQKIWQGKKNVRGLSIHPNGKQIAFSTGTQEQVIWVMENFLPKTTDKK